MRTFQYAEIVPSNNGGIIRDCPLSMTNRGQWITQQRLTPNQSVLALIPLDKQRMY